MLGAAATIVIVAGCLACGVAAAAGFLGNGKPKKAPTRCMIARLVVWLVQNSQVFGPKQPSGVRECVAARSLAHPACQPIWLWPKQSGIST